MQSFSICETLNSRNFSIGRLDCEHEAGPDSIAIADNRTGTANAMLASHVGPGKIELLAQKIGQQHTRFRHPLA
jgi:hypothetical protein